MRLVVEGDEELGVLFEVTCLAPPAAGMSDEGRTVTAAVRWWFETGAVSADPYELAKPFPEHQRQISDSILNRIRSGLRDIVDGPDLARARVARRLLNRNWAGGPDDAQGTGS